MKLKNDYGLFSIKEINVIHPFITEHFFVERKGYEEIIYNFKQDSFNFTLISL